MLKIPSRRNRKVLLVEDSDVNQKILTNMLRREGCCVVLAVNGQEGVKKFAQHPFDLVLMDIQMPIMDGLDATRLIRKHQLASGTRTPIVAITAGIDRGTCMNAGVDAYIEKPVRVGMLQAVLQQLCELEY